MANQGYNDLTEQFLAEKLDKYKHIIIKAGYERIERYLANHNACIVGIYKSAEREKYIAYSIPRLLIMPNGLIVRYKDKAKFAPYINNGKVDVVALAMNRQLLAGVSDGRMYKGPIDTAINAHQHGRHFLFRSGPDVFPGLLHMLDKGRIDYTFGFPVELSYQVGQHLTEQPMAFIPVKDMPETTLSYIGCSKNAWGEKIITQINNILTQYRTKPEYLKFYQSWLDSDSRRTHQILTNKYFATKTPIEGAM